MPDIQGFGGWLCDKYIEKDVNEAFFAPLLTLCLCGNKRRKRVLGIVKIFILPAHQTTAP
ncbi:MAG TPA: hypothetical protein VFE54_03300 [Mucilaginibacter sp.]|nr:hypothetical protein [Mucilaginibacter sp.]